MKKLLLRMLKQLYGLWLASDGKFSIKIQMYLGMYETEDWVKIVWFKNDIPKHAFVSWMIFKKDLITFGPAKTSLSIKLVCFGCCLVNSV